VTQVEIGLVLSSRSRRLIGQMREAPSSMPPVPSGGSQALRGDDRAYARRDMRRGRSFRWWCCDAARAPAACSVPGLPPIQAFWRFGAGCESANGLAQRRYASLGNGVAAASDGHLCHLLSSRLGYSRHFIWRFRPCWPWRRIRETNRCRRPPGGATRHVTRVPPALPAFFNLLRPAPR